MRTKVINHLADGYRAGAHNPGLFLGFLFDPQGSFVDIWSFGTACRNMDNFGEEWFGK